MLREGFLKHVNSNNLPQFKKYNKILEKLQWLYHYKKNEIMTVEQQSQYDELIIEESNFYNAFNEYIEFLQWENSYKMWTKTILPEVFVWENLSKNEKRHESQKPLNTLEEIILQTSNSWETVVEQFAWSFIGAEAVINLGNEWKGWRNYIGIELDKERVLDAKKHLKEKYKDLVKIDTRNQIIIDDECKTSTTGIFACGDVTNEAYKQIVIAAGYGAKAALSCYKFLQAKLDKKVPGRDWVK